MKSFKLIFLISFFSIMFYGHIYAVDTVITLFIKQAEKISPQEIDNRPIELVSEKLIQPSFVFGKPKHLAPSNNEGIAGINATYLGYITTSNKNGQITFPRKQQSDQIYILITPKILPNFIVGPTLIHHWEIDQSQPAEMYEVNRKKDKKLNTYYFDVINLKEAIKDPSTPKKDAQNYLNILKSKDAIPFNTITLLTDPANITVPMGITLNNYSTNFILPTLTANNEFDTTENSLYTLSIKQYFEQINIESKNDSPKIATIIGNQ